MRQPGCRVSILVITRISRIGGTHIANDVGIAELDAECGGWVDAGVHAGQDEVFLCRGQGEVALGEGAGVALGGGLDVLLDGRHGGLGWVGLVGERWVDAGVVGYDVVM